MISFCFTIMVCFNNVFAVVFSVSGGGFMRKYQICKMLKSSIPLISTHFRFSEKLLSGRQWGCVFKYKKSYISEMVNMNIMTQNVITYC